MKKDKKEKKQKSFFFCVIRPVTRHVNCAVYLVSCFCALYLGSCKLRPENTVAYPCILNPCFRLFFYT